MARTVQKVNKKRVIMALLSLVLINTGCEDRIDSSGVGGEKMVEVSLNIGIADEADGYNLSVAPASKAGSPKNGAFDMQLVPTATTRAVSSKPDKLYKLEIRQYSQDGTSYLGGIDPTDQVIGETFTASLQEATGCQLVFVAWGQNSSKKLGTGNLTSAQDITVDASAIKDIPTTDMNAMPYVLHLKNVNVTNAGKITSPSGEDVRVLLKRLAVRLNMAWDYKVSDYTLKQILLQSIPLDYKIVAAPDEKEGNTYPSLLDQFTTIQLTDSEIAAGNYSCWIPANVRGTNAYATSPLHRIKSNAPTGSAYASFIAVNTTDAKKKLDYRVYLGGSDYTDFNLFGNTDYSYTIDFKHVGLPVNDRRVTIIDPIPASESNSNIVPTANCFMIAPGGAFCFDPFAYQQNGTPITNSTLKGWSDSEGGIAYVKLLWQTKENGDLGDPVMGVVNSSDDHTNIVDLKNGMIYCRVAPNTQGGNGVIAAFSSTNKIIWSWHIWVTNYQPDATGNVSIYSPANKRKQKYTYRCDDQLPIMDRNLGANAGYTEVPRTELEKSMANGLHYQWGRKDPFPSSYSSQQTTEIIVASDKPTKGMLNLYEPDGISFFKRSYSEQSSTGYSVVYQNPTSFYQNWQSFTDANWQTGTELKNEHDPCPAGWRVTSFKNCESFFTQEGYTESKTSEKENVPINIKNGNSVKADGGALLYYEGKGSGPVTYYRFNGYQRYTNKFMYIGLMTNIWCREMNNNKTAAYALSVNYGGYPFSDGNGIANNIRSTWNQADAHAVRCIQEKE